PGWKMCAVAGGFLGGRQAGVIRCWLRMRYAAFPRGLLMQTQLFAGAAVAVALFGGTALAQYRDICGLKLNKPEDKVDVKSTPPPKDAIILFDGKALDNWTKTDGKSAPEWKLVDGGAMEVTKGGNIITKEKFDGSFKLHVEFRVPYMPKA